jgi:hypothetical protein
MEHRLSAAHVRPPWKKIGPNGRHNAGKSVTPRAESIDLAIGYY